MKTGSFSWLGSSQSRNNHWLHKHWIWKQSFQVPKRIQILVGDYRLIYQIDWSCYGLVQKGPECRQETAKSVSKWFILYERSLKWCEEDKNPGQGKSSCKNSSRKEGVVVILRVKHKLTDQTLVNRSPGSKLPVIGNWQQARLHHAPWRQDRAGTGKHTKETPRTLTEAVPCKTETASNAVKYLIMYNHVHIPTYYFSKVVRTDNLIILKIKNWNYGWLRYRYRSVYHPHYKWKELTDLSNFGQDLCWLKSNSEVL